MFISKARYDREMAEKNAEIIRLELGLADRNNELNRVRGEKTLAGNVARELLDELAPLKAAKARQLQNLRNANAARSARAKAGLPASVVEGVS